MRSGSAQAPPAGVAKHNVQTYLFDSSELDRECLCLLPRSHRLSCQSAGCDRCRILRDDSSVRASLRGVSTPPGGPGSRHVTHSSRCNHRNVSSVYLNKRAVNHSWYWWGDVPKHPVGMLVRVIRLFVVTAITGKYFCAAREPGRVSESAPQCVHSS